MSKNLPAGVGFTSKPSPSATGGTPAACIALVTTVALALSTLIAVTVVSIGIARADTIVPGDTASTPLAIALFFGVVMAGMGVLTALAARDWGSRN